LNSRGDPVPVAEIVAGSRRFSSDVGVTQSHF